MRGSFETLFLIVALVGAPFLAMLFTRLGRRHHARLQAVVLNRWNARIRQGAFFKSDRIDIRVDDIAGVITYNEHTNKASSGQARSGWTRVRLGWPSDRRLRVVPEGIATRLHRFLGGSEVRFDDPPFDDLFWIESSHPTWARAILDPAIRRRILKLRFSPLSPDPEMTLDLGPAGLSFRISAVLMDDPAALGSFVELAIAVLQKARGLVESADIRVEVVRMRSGSTCPVCGHPVDDQSFPCSSCRTPHHRECWSYFGGCGIFGCGGRLREAS